MPVHLTDLLSPFAQPWLRRVQSELDLVPQPADSPRQVVAGTAADHVLLVGNGPLIGFGVRTHELALPGQLARQLAQRTGRGVVVDVVTQRGLRVEQASALLQTRRPGRYDAVVIAVGATDSAGLTPIERWRTGLERLLGDARASVAEGTVVMLLPASPLQQTASGGRRRRLSEVHALDVDAVSAAVCAARGDIHFLSGVLEEQPPRSVPDYIRLADRLSTALAGPLGALAALESTSTARRQRHTPDPELVRQQALERTGLVGTGSNAVLDRLLQHARDLFGASAAAVTLVDGERIAVKASSGMDVDSAPRAIAPCNRTIRQDGPYVAADLAGEPISEHGWRFYAGHPLESPDGYRIGTLCVFDTGPKETSEADRIALIELASRVQAKLWREIQYGPRSPDEANVDSGSLHLQTLVRD